MNILSKFPSLCAGLFALLVCVFLAATDIPSRPIFPVDETRYLTVAWEMFLRGNWILPTLNGESYHHKPPLLFWLIMSMWKLFGVSEYAAMAVPYLISICGVAALIRMVRVMMPENPGLPLLATALYLGSLPFVLYSHLIMFDMLLGVFAILGITAIWQFATTGLWRHILILGLCIGLGVLAKGPVILLHLLFPVVLAAVWLPKDRRMMGWGKWAGGFIAAILLGAAIALSWAIPAAIEGGPAFAEKIFWGQTAGRVANSFDHQKPVWWYLPFVFLFAMPWIFHSAVWRGFKQLRADPQTMMLRFLGCWLLPVFISFSLISGKQVHYLLPLLPGVILLLALALDRARDSIKPSQAIAAIIICTALTLIPALFSIINPEDLAFLEGKAHIQGSFDKLSAPLALGGAAAILAVGFFCVRRGLTGQVIGIALAMMIFIGCFQIQAKRSFYMNYDLTPIAAIVHDLPETTPLAFVRNYHGEWGFLARLNRPVKQLDLHQLDAWFEEHPEGVAFIRTKRAHEFEPYDVIFSMPYKMTNTYAVIAKRGQGNRFTPRHPLQ